VAAASSVALSGVGTLAATGMATMTGPSAPLILNPQLVLTLPAHSITLIPPAHGLALTHPAHALAIHHPDTKLRLT
jgi:hypothetical protein